ncbi:hypothetical protein jhhlp_004643 [Lomentospora prolificans]|uniref:MAPEG family protein n=1 Tax=Lomentospora prolificans TaxID=41688 RepID=A0A2N3NC61_9PEZI|nr:hypothetical protein jhhlp_004643 [Lomentospora prolificans]
MALVNFESNISFYTVPVGFLLAMLPHLYAISSGIKKYNPGNPRQFESTIASDSTIDKITKLRIIRAKSASANAFETLGLYAAAVVAGNIAQLDKDTLNWLSSLYVISRVLYIITYIWLQENRALSPLRTVFWGGSIWSIVSLFLKAGHAMA